MRIEWSAQSRADLAELVVYIAHDNVAAAYRIHTLIIERVAGLADHPMMGRPGRIRPTRELVVSGTPYVVVYEVRADHLFLLRVLHGAQRWPDA